MKCEKMAVSFVLLSEGVAAKHCAHLLCDFGLRPTLEREPCKCCGKEFGLLAVSVNVLCSIVVVSVLPVKKEQC